MWAALLYGPKDIRIEEVGIPEISENELLIKVKTAALCGTDIRMYLNGHEAIDEQNPRVLGHEFAGVLDKVGENLTGYSVGMRVTVAPNFGCGICDHCVSGNTHLCEDYQALGIHLEGGFAEYVRIPEAAVRQGNVTILNDQVSFAQATLAEPLSCVYNAFTIYDVNPGDSVLIIGAGPIGLMHASLAKMAGAGKVLINDLSEDRVEFAHNYDPFFTPVTSSNLKEAISEMTSGKGVDVCVIAAPAPQAQALSLELLAVGGRASFFGGLPKTKELVTLNTNLIHYRQLMVSGSSKANLLHYRTTIKLIEDGLINVEGLVSTRNTLADFGLALQAALKADGLKNLIVF